MATVLCIVCLILFVQDESFGQNGVQAAPAPDERFELFISCYILSHYVGR